MGHSAVVAVIAGEHCIQQIREQTVRAVIGSQIRLMEHQRIPVAGTEIVEDLGGFGVDNLLVRKVAPPKGAIRAGLGHLLTGGLGCGNVVEQVIGMAWIKRDGAGWIAVTDRLVGVGCSSRDAMCRRQGSECRTLPQPPGRTDQPRLGRICRYDTVSCIWHQVKGTGRLLVMLDFQDALSIAGVVQQPMGITVVDPAKPPAVRHECCHGGLVDRDKCGGGAVKGEVERQLPAVALPLDTIQPVDGGIDITGRQPVDWATHVTGYFTSCVRLRMLVPE